MKNRRYLTHDFEDEISYTIYQLGELDYDYAFEWRDKAGVLHEQSGWQSQEEAQDAARADIRQHKKSA